jgi:hypothetical protein
LGIKNKEIIFVLGIINKKGNREMGNENRIARYMDSGEVVGIVERRIGKGFKIMEDILLREGEESRNKIGAFNSMLGFLKVMHKREGEMYERRQGVGSGEFGDIEKIKEQLGMVKKDG